MIVHAEHWFDIKCDSNRVITEKKRETSRLLNFSSGKFHVMKSATLKLSVPTFLTLKLLAPNLSDTHRIIDSFTYMYENWCWRFVWSNAYHISWLCEMEQGSDHISQEVALFDVSLTMSVGYVRWSKEAIIFPWESHCLIFCRKEADDSFECSF